MPKEHHPEQRGTHNEQSEPQEPWAGGVENVKNWTREEKGAFLDVAFSFLGTVGIESPHEGELEDYFEIELDRAGLVERLEQKGVLPPREDLEKRQEVLKHLYSGAVLGYVFGEGLLSFLRHPSPRFPWTSQK